MNKSQVVEKLSLDAPLVKIIRKGEWLKVGDRHTGKVGWVNLKEYRKAREDFYKPNIQTVFINVTQNDKGKKTVNVVAYKNGEKVSDKEAKSLYEKLLKQQSTQRSYWENFNRNMMRQERDMDRLFQDNFRMFGPSFTAPPIILMPGPVIPNQQPKTQKQEPAAKQSLRQRKRVSV